MIDADQFAREWVRAWNDHDIEAVLTHFDDAVLFTSPVALKVLPSTGGVVQGKAALREYWTTVLVSVPDLEFAVEGVFGGIDTVVIAYRNQNGGVVSEVLRFNEDGLVIEGHATHLIRETPPT
ncbi:nuclear transport factor 2 family protein [Mycolicibacterium sp. BiH015]|uniref:nuclear transport factor 2 family protein n=1 Tax=Mycolicibacterium sp. BiH015 TaxID=3018808 RepID=UPI0022E8182E|nr:nuclear transport factor 2 family protein [Mycolicibacterium sp. BiH015]MDA2893786.1 nuclear transport factor 2 family protein [Mycolicibacterium sp. BiH015]